MPCATWAGTGRGNANTNPTSRYNATAWSDKGNIESDHVVRKEASHYRNQCNASARNSVEDQKSDPFAL